MFRAFLFCVFLLSVSGCASDPYLLPESDSESTAPGAAFTGAGMYMRKPMPDRRDAKPWEFYYKRCSMSGDSSAFSRTVYECSGPFY
ncbi:MAG: hypothetical protein KF799_09700 [Bdellovibrionales bacterium]|nr:hypothetical protein [Bdellovibrionales bacterium]